MDGISRVPSVAFIVTLLCHSCIGGSSCPPYQNILPCYCTNGNHGSGTMMICSKIDDSNQLSEATNGMKGMVLERFLLMDSFRNQAVEVNETNELVAPEPKDGERLPAQWLSTLRVKDLEIQHTNLSSCFLCDEPFVGQSNFLVSLTAKYASLDGHLCNTCNTRTKSVSLRELSKVPHLKYLDLSWNNIEYIDGMAFPAVLAELTKVIISNNNIKTIHDNAFATLGQLTDLDLSNNQIAAISRRTFNSGAVLRSLDLSWNSIKSLPEGLFGDLRSLKELKISYNLIEVLPTTVWSRIPANIQRLDFKGNFLVCNCTMSWIKRYLPRSTKVIGNCAYPPEVESQELKGNLTSLNSCN